MQIGLSNEERNDVEGLKPKGLSKGAVDPHVLTATASTGRSVTASRLAYDPPLKVAELQLRTMQWLTRPYPLGLRFSGINMDPLPGWLAGAHYVALNMCQNDLPVQLHHALFKGTGGYVLKPLEMRTGAPWPPARDSLRRVTIEVLSLHNLPKRAERRPRLEGSRGECHKFVPDLSGTGAPPDTSEPASIGLHLSLHNIGGFCAVGSSLPLPLEPTTKEWRTEATGSQSGLSVSFAQKTLHCLAAEPDATFLRLAVFSGEDEVAYETAVLGRLRPGYRVFQLRSELGTRIELCYLLVKISFGSEPNQWPTARQLQQVQEAKVAALKSENAALKSQLQEVPDSEVDALESENAAIKSENAALKRELDELRTKLGGQQSTEVNTHVAILAQPAAEQHSPPALSPQTRWLATAMNEDNHGDVDTPSASSQTGGLARVSSTVHRI